MRAATALIVISLLAAACGESVDRPALTAPDQSAAVTETTAAAPPPSQASEETARGPAAPDFQLTLSDGTEFVLSSHLAETGKNLYLVFWAEG